MNILEIENLSASFTLDGKKVTPVRGVTFSIPEKGRVALVGESGCGKSLTALSIRSLPPIDKAILGGRIAKRDDLRISYVFQNPMEALNPVMKISAQMDEAFPRDVSKGERRERTVSLLARTGLKNPERIANSYPCQLSGGQCQRAMIAMALASKPQLLVCDEPTTALDVTTQKQVLELIDSLSSEFGMALLFITHNLGLVAGWMDEVNVMYAGKIVESGKVTEVLAHPRHPYTKGLLAAVPRIDSPRDAPLTDIPGVVPSPADWPEGCAFEPRCPYARAACKTGDVKCPEMA